MNNTYELDFRIILESPPAGVAFGLQKGRGNGYETVQTQRSSGEDLVFEWPMTVQSDARGLAFKGPFAQGTRDQPFVYLDIGTAAGQFDSPWTRRLKIPLYGLDLGLVQQAAAQPGAVLEARVPGTGRDGGPNCATVKGFGGWGMTLE